MVGEEIRWPGCWYCQGLSPQGKVATGREIWFLHLLCWGNQGGIVSANTHISEELEYQRQLYCDTLLVKLFLNP